MKATTVFLAVLAAVLLQVALARYAVGGRWVFDLVLVGVAFAALQGGALAGMVAGTVGGLLQDVLSGGIVGVGGLAKTVVGCVVGVVSRKWRRHASPRLRPCRDPFARARGAVLEHEERRPAVLSAWVAELSGKEQ